MTARLLGKSLSMRSSLKKTYFTIREFCLHALGLLPVFSGNPEPKNQPEKIAVISQCRLGDAVFAVPLLQTLHARFPKADICVVSPPYVGEVFEMLPEVQAVIEYRRGSPWSGFVELLNTSRELRKCRFDLIIDLNTDGVLASSMLTFLSKPAFSIGYGQYGRGIFYKQSLEFPQWETPMVDLMINTLAPLSIAEPVRSIRLPVGREDIQEIYERLPWLRSPGHQTVVGLHPGAHHPTQRWPVAYYADLADRLIGTGRVQVILCGGRGDQSLIQEMRQQMTGIPHVVPDTLSLKALAALFSTLDLLICNNSGPLHLAGAVGTRTISFMGPTRA
ncbi:MAG: glycosyltransferase family 9 protein, partial [bacterium]|nr:glycosyltransferase family 9 protein [bacterium]